MHTKPKGRQRRRAAALLVVFVAVLATGASWMFSSGVVTLAATPAPGSGGIGGATAAFAPLDVSVTRPSAPTQSAGYALGRVTVATAYEASTRVSFSWTDPRDAANPLNYCSQSGNASSCAGWIAFGLYYPVHTGRCWSLNSPGYQHASPRPTLDLLTDVTIRAGATTYCVALDTGASGHLAGSSQGSGASGPAGQVLVSEEMLGSYLTPGSAAAPSFTGSGRSYSSSVPCRRSVTGSASTVTWCTPSPYVAKEENVFFLVATVVLPGYSIPYGGQEAPAGSMRFYATVS